MMTFFIVRSAREDFCRFMATGKEICIASGVRSGFCPRVLLAACGEAQRKTRLFSAASCHINFA
jgi:hypothetical protein